MTDFADRVKETTATTGTGAITLGGAVAGFQTFAAGFDNKPCVVGYAIEDGNNWEIGEGTLNAAGNTLTRDTIFDGSSGTSPINLSGTAKVFCTLSSNQVKRSNIGRVLALANGWALN